MDIYGPILLVDPQTRRIVANEPDSLGVLKNEGGRYIGILPGEMNIANTAVNWNGKRWAMILLPLSTNRNERLNLITHELFHRAQPSLKFTSVNADNNHLDTREGRIYLRLELEALRMAIQSLSRQEATTHIGNALLFRKARQHLFPHADSTENLLELNEGLAEYTGLVMSERSKDEMLQHLKKSIEDFPRNKTFVRSFAYITIPVYGHLAATHLRNLWNQDITAGTNLTDYFIAAFNVKIPVDLEAQAVKLSDKYNGELIRKEERQREDDNLKLINEMIVRFVKDPHLEIQFEKMNVSFDPRNLIPLENYGTVYPNLRITDNWGILTVDGGALLSSDWRKVSVTIPNEKNNNLLKGKGWTLELKDDKYLIVRDKETSNYYLKKK